MRRTVLSIIFVIVSGYLIYILRWLPAPDFDQGFERNLLTINDGLDVIERVVSDLPGQPGLWSKPERGYFLKILGGNPSSEFLKRFRKYPIPRIRRGYIKYWATVKERAEMEIYKLVELNDSEVKVIGVIRYPKKIVDEFEYKVTRDMSGWKVTNRKLINRSTDGKQSI
jgi:hypothetical protein